ncbi:diguanylate cyclase domain-containing protein [Geminocystis sp. GBBB08]|uniref:diguanylate cyclase domain-containing protein n=1 Tax=Geminocystis sp. GBBB08 TaxID=2604140 RepID=UPI0027E25A52|nr:diguanylate cyclase [Geminocystis sp. GBBB08]MBL1210934.1 diguanylate cyclase [Geminocystis sp. GBBB08]
MKNKPSFPDSNNDEKNNQDEKLKSVLPNPLTKQEILEQEKIDNTPYLYVLIIEDGSDQRIIYLTDEIYEIGRRKSAEIIFHDQSVSRHHATICKEYNQEENLFFYKIFDGNLSEQLSRNGLLINNKKYLSKYLEHGDLIEFSKLAKARYFVIDKNSQVQDIFHVNQDNSFEKKESYNKKTLTSNPYNVNQSYLEKENIIDYIAKLTSFAELSPYPIVEINLQGKITYYNQAASLSFPSLINETMSHPVLSNLLKAEHKIHGNLFVREVRYNDKIFEQYIHYLPDLKLIRSYLFDFTNRKKVEAKLKDSEAKYRAVVEQMSEGIFLFTAEDSMIIEANISATKILGYPLEELIHQNIEQFLDTQYQTFIYNLEILKETKLSFRQELKLKVKQHQPIDVELNVSLINYQNKLVFCCVFRDISERKLLENQLKYHAYHDSLTGLYKRNFFMNFLSKTLANAKRQKTTVAIMFLDIDYFKEINDNYGHDVGDLFLQEFSQRLKNALRESDCLARWGGDEFVALLPDITSPNTLTIIIDRILKSIKKPFIYHQITLNTSTSIGIAIYPIHDENIDSLLKKADQALYTTKQNGRNGYTIYHQE